MSFQEHILEQINRVNQSELDEWERIVWQMLVDGMHDAGRWITQLDMLKMEPRLGSHPRHEAGIVKDPTETTTRQVRQIIFDLRNTWKAPIISGRDGYKICTSADDALEFMNRLEGETKAVVKARFETYKAMKQALDVGNEYMERLAL